VFCGRSAEPCRQGYPYRTGPLGEEGRRSAEPFFRGNPGSGLPAWPLEPFERIQSSSLVAEDRSAKIPLRGYGGGPAAGAARTYSEAGPDSGGIRRSSRLLPFRNGGRRNGGVLHQASCRCRTRARWSPRRVRLDRGAATQLQPSVGPSWNNQAWQAVARCPHCRRCGSPESPPFTEWVSKGPESRGGVEFLLPLET